MKKILAIINCKSKKQDYSCSAEEMYLKSPAFKEQINFFKKINIPYKIFSTKYGLIDKNDIIEPYNLCIGKLWINDIKDNKNIINEEDYKLLIENVKNNLENLLKEYDIIHFHCSEFYYKPFKKLSKNIIHIKQQKFTHQVIKKYNESTLMYNGNNLDECLNNISFKPKYNKLEPKIYYHNKYSPNGIGPIKSFKLSKYINDNFNIKIDFLLLDNVYRGKIKHFNGWVINKDYLPKIKELPNNKYIFIK